MCGPPTFAQVRNQGRRRGGKIFALSKILAPLEKCVGHGLKLLDIVQKMWLLSENPSLLLVSQAGYGAAVA